MFVVVAHDATRMGCRRARATKSIAASNASEERRNSRYGGLFRIACVARLQTDRAKTWRPCAPQLGALSWVQLVTLSALEVTPRTEGTSQNRERGLPANPCAPERRNTDLTRT